ncbi:MAG: hypothetical protein RIT28_252 [Pseudomonadota bacterium]
MLLPLALFACSPDPSPALLLAVDRDEDGEYRVAPRPIPELTDAQHMEGALGHGYRGGRIAIDLFSADMGIRYDEGGRMDLDYDVVDDVAIPMDEDGLVLWTYYHTLSQVRADLNGLGVDTEPVWPIDFAYQPAFVGMDFTSGENAAYLGSGVHLFILLPDALPAVLPLAANPGVIRHEFGHALFNVLTAGDAFALAPYDESEDPNVANQVRALNEGFADMIATLTLDDNDFFDLSLPSVTTRDVAADAAADASMYPENAESYDPYALGTVYASFAWDLRALTSPDEAVVLVVAAVDAWSAEAAWGDTDRWAELLLELAVAEDEALQTPLCAAFTARFPERPTPETCA